MTRFELMNGFIDDVLVHDINPVANPINTGEKVGFLIKKGNGLETQLNRKSKPKQKDNQSAKQDDNQGTQQEEKQASKKKKKQGFDSIVLMEDYQTLFFLLIHQDSFYVKFFTIEDDFEDNKDDEKKTKTNSKKSKSIVGDDDKKQLKQDAIIRKTEAYFYKQGISFENVRHLCGEQEYIDILCKAVLRHVIAVAFSKNPGSTQNNNQSDNISELFEQSMQALRADLFKIEFRLMRSSVQPVKIYDSQFKPYTHEVHLTLNRPLPSYTVITKTGIVLPLKLDEVCKQWQEQVKKEQSLSRYEMLVKGLRKFSLNQEIDDARLTVSGFMERNSDEKTFPLSDKMLSKPDASFSKILYITCLNEHMINTEYADVKTQVELINRIRDHAWRDICSEHHKKIERYYYSVIAYLNDVLSRFTTLDFRALMNEKQEAEICEFALKIFDVDVEYVFHTVRKYEDDEENVCRFISRMILRSIYCFTIEIAEKDKKLGEDICEILGANCEDIYSHRQKIKDFLQSPQFADIAAEQEANLNNQEYRECFGFQTTKNPENMSNTELLERINDTQLELGRVWASQYDCFQNNQEAPKYESDVSFPDVFAELRRIESHSENEQQTITASTDVDTTEYKHGWTYNDREEKCFAIMFAVLKKSLKQYLSGLGDATETC